MESRLQERAQEQGQTTVEYAQVRAAEAARSLKETSGVAGALLRTAVSSALVAVHERNFDAGHLRADLAATVADLTSETHTRRHLVALGGGYFLDWLLQLAYPPTSGDSNSGGSVNSSPVGSSGGGSDSNPYAFGGNGRGAGMDSDAAALGGDEGFSVTLGPGGVPAPAGGGRGRISSLLPWAAPEGAVGRGEAAAGQVLPPGGTGSALDASSQSAARLCREAERALESILRDDVAAGLLLERPGAVPLLLHAAADGRASGGVTVALAARASEARSAAEAMTEDLREVVDVLRGRVAGRSCGLLGLQCTAAGLLSAWAAGSGFNRAKLTELGLQGVLAEMATAVSGLSDRAAVGLQWELLRLVRVMAEHCSSSDSHQLAACVLPLLYIAADAAAAEDAAMAAYAIDTLAAAVRHGGPPVATVVSDSTMPHLLWQLAEAMGSHRVLTASPLADGKDGAAAIAGAVPGGAQQAAAAAGAAAAVNTKAKVARGWFFGRTGSGSAAATGRDVSAAAVVTGGGGGGAAAPAVPPVGSRKVLQVQDPAVAASVAAAVAELARCSLLPEEQVPRWRDWLLDVLCSDGFDPVTSGRAPGAATVATAAASLSSSSASERAKGHSLLPRQGEEVREGATAGSGSSSSSAGWQLRRRLPAWLTLPEAARWQPQGVAGSGDGAEPAGERGREQRPREERKDCMDAVRASVVAALAALSHMPGNHGLQAVHYWLSRLLSELAARTLPYTSLVYLEGPRAPQDLIHAVPVLPGYVRSVADALERAADAVADDAPPLPPHLEFDLAGSGLVGRPTHDAEPRRPGSGKARSDSSGKPGSSPQQRRDVSERQQHPQQPQLQRDAQQAAADVAAYRQAAHVVDVVVAERKAADALEALCAIVAPDSAKQRWLLQRGVLPLLHRLTRTADDPRVVLREQGQPGAKHMDLEAAAAATGPDQGAAAAPPLGGPQWQPHPPSAAQSHPHDTQLPRQNLHLRGQDQHTYQHHYQPQHHSQHLRSQEQPSHQVAQHGKGQQEAPVVVSELMSDHEGGPSLCLQRQVARMLALLALLPDARADVGGRGRILDALPAAAGGAGGAGGGAATASWPRPQSDAEGDAVAGRGWLPWLHNAATSSDCRLSSNATRALLHMAALDAATAAAAAAAVAARGAGSAAGCGAGSALPDSTLAAMAPSPPPTPPPVFLDGIHLLDPGAPHHWALVRHVAAAATESAVLTVETAVAVMASRGDEVAATAGGSDDSQVPGGSGVPGAATAVSGAPVTAAVSAPAPPLPEPMAAAPSTRAFGPAGGGAAAVTMGCGAAGDGGNGALMAAPLGVHQAPSIAGSLVGALRYLVALPLSLWGATALSSASYGSVADASLPTQPAVSAASAAEPFQAFPRTAATEEMAPSAHADDGRTTEPPQSPVTAGTKDPGPNDPAAASADAAGGTLGPPSPIPPYPEPYPDMGTAGPRAESGDHASQQPYASGAFDGAVVVTSASEAGLPSVDVVFVHGIRGGPFITWRKAGVMTRGSAASHMERSACWPSTWLAEDLPGARLLSVEYLAPVSAWEGESLSLEDNVSRVMGQLAAAGVGTGQRPVVFVAHSMGGLLVKEMLARSMDQAAEGGGPNAALAASTRGIVFFGTPHFGNAMAAMGWKLRYVPGALPAPSLARLTPGPHLLSLNDRLRQLHDAQGGALRVVSLLEGQPTQLSGVIPRILIVAPDSAYPGFGAALTLPHNDHIDCCKPAGRAAPAYGVVRELVEHAVRAAAPGGG